MKLLKLLLVISLVLLFGCSSQYYNSRAVNRARAYAIEKMPELSESARHFIKYTPPRMLESLVLAREAPGTTSKKDVIQMCMVWPHPEQEGMYIVVSGVSERRLDDWFPNRVLVKRFDELPPEKKKDDKDNK